MSNGEASQEANGKSGNADAAEAMLASAGEASGDGAADAGAETAPVAPVPAKSAAPKAAVKKGGDEHSSIGVGEKFTLGEEDAALLKESQLNIQNLKITYAEKAFAFHADELALFQAIEKATSDQKTLLSLVGNKHGLKIDKSAAQYGFDIHSMTFTRVK